MKKISDNQRILLAHGSGGKLTHDLIREVFLPKLSNPVLNELADSAVFEIGDKRLAFTTDSYVVKPLFFPGGDIGKLSVYGTVNDLAVMGARPLFISCGLIIEEGLEFSILEKIADSLQEAARIAQVEIVTGDIKVVEHGSADRIFINTSGVGSLSDRVNLSKDSIETGDKVIISGTIGDHGIAILSSREGFDFKTEINSDSAPLNDLILTLFEISGKIKFMRDPTRGGLATTLNEIVEKSNYSIVIEEEKVPIKEEVRGVCELLGFDPLYVANEGKVVVIVSSEDADKVCCAMRKHERGRNSCIIGEVIAEPKGKVCMKTVAGGTRIIDMLVGEQIPRIC